MVDIPAGFKVVAPAAPPIPEGFRVKSAEPQGEWAEPGMLAPIQYKLGPDGRPVESRWAFPRIITDTIKAIEAPGKALQGEYGLEIDPETYHVTPFTREMIGDTLGTAGLGLTPFNPAAQAGAKVAQGLIKPGAAKVVRRELDAAGIPAAEIGQRLSALGPDAMIADLTPGLRARTAAIATMPGNGQKSVVDALSARRAGSNARIQGDVDAALGPAPVPSYVRRDIDAAQKALGPLYDRVFKAPGVKAVDTSGIAADLDSMSVTLRGGSSETARKIREMLDVFTSPEDRKAGQYLLDQEWKANGSVGPKPVYQPPLDPSPETLHQVRRTVGGMLSAAEGQIGADPTTVGTLKYIYGKIDRALTEAVPGIKEIDAQFQDLARQKDAFTQGMDLLDSGKTALRPEEVSDLMTGPATSRRLTADEQGPSPQDPVGGPRGAGLLVGPSGVPLKIRAGTRAEIDRIIGTNIRDINAMKRIVAGEGNWNRDRLVSVFGQEKADRLLSILEREAAYNATEELALQGSRTQVLKAAQEDIAGKGPRANPVRDLGNLKFGDAVTNAADGALGWLYRSQRGATNNSLADVLTSGSSNLEMLSALGQPTVGPVVQRGGSDFLRMLAQMPPGLDQQERRK